MSSTNPERPTSIDSVTGPSTTVLSSETVRQVLPALASGNAVARRAPKLAMTRSPSTCEIVLERAADQLERRRAAVGGCLGVEAEGPEHVDPSQVAPVVEGGGQHADDLLRFTVDAHGAADDAGIASEAVLPATLADDEHTVVAVDFFVPAKVPTELGCGAQGREEVGGDAESRRPSPPAGLVPRGSCQRPCRRLSCRSRASRAADRGSRRVRCRRRDSAESSGRCAPAARCRGRGAAEQDPLSDAEHRGVGPDAEPERDDREQREPRRLQQLADGEAQIRARSFERTGDGLEPAGVPDAPHRIADGRDVAELPRAARRAASGLSPRSIRSCTLKARWPRISSSRSRSSGPIVALHGSRVHCSFDSCQRPCPRS